MSHSSKLLKPREGVIGIWFLASGVRSTGDKLDLWLAWVRESHRIELFTRGIWCLIQVDGVRIELNCRTPSWGLRIAFWRGDLLPHWNCYQNPFMYSPMLLWNSSYLDLSCQFSISLSFWSIFWEISSSISSNPAADLKKKISPILFLTLRALPSCSQNVALLKNRILFPFHACNPSYLWGNEYLLKRGLLPESYPFFEIPLYWFLLLL